MINFYLKVCWDSTKTHLHVGVETGAFAQIGVLADIEAICWTLPPNILVLYRYRRKASENKLLAVNKNRTLMINYSSGR